MELVLSLCLGLGLSAACGFRVFVPMLVLSVAGATGHLTLAGSFEWIASLPALVTFAVATVVEIGAFYVPWLDNALDAVASPAAVVAGIVASASCVAEMDPWLTWSFAVIAGGGSAGAVQTGTVLLRGASSVATGGLGNFAVNSGESMAAFGLAVVAVLLPLVAAFVFLVAFVAVAVRLARRRRASPESP